jgi:hypothetical protein
MWKWLGIVAIASVGILAAQSAPKQEVAKEQVGSSTQVSTTSNNKQNDPKVAMVVKQKNTAPQDEHGAENAEDIQVQKSNLNLTRWLIGVGGVQAIILFFTIRAIDKQTGTNQHIERAWVMVELRCGPGANLLTGDQIEHGVTTLNTSVMGVEIHCTNDGNSPAWIIEKSARLVVVGPNELPEKSQLTSADIIQNAPEPLGPGRETVFKWDAMGEGRHSIKTATLIYGNYILDSLF